MIGGCDGLAARERDRARDADADAADVRRASRPISPSSSAKRSWTDVEHGFGAVARSRCRTLVSASGAPARSVTREARVRRAEVRDEDDAARRRLKASTVGGRPPVDALPPAS